MYLKMIRIEPQLVSIAGVALLYISSTRRHHLHNGSTIASYITINMSCSVCLNGSKISIHTSSSVQLHHYPPHHIVAQPYGNMRRGREWVALTLLRILLLTNEIVSPLYLNGK